MTRRVDPYASFLAVVAIALVWSAIRPRDHTYAGMPLFDWLRAAHGLARNHFDRVGHFAQGFIPAIFVREWLRRAGGLRPGARLGFLSVSVCLAFSAFYELLEWGIVLTFYPDSGPEWLGMQGDPWDAQQDMLMALCGATASILLLSRAHERSMAALRRGPISPAAEAG